MKLGSNNIDAVKLGSQNVDKIYVGSTQIWPLSTAYTAPEYINLGIQLYYNPEDPASYSGSGNTINDLSPNGYNGTIDGATYSTNSFLFDGSDDFIYTPNMYDTFNANRNFTLEVWYNPSWVNPNEGGTVVSEVSDIGYTNWHYSLMEHKRAPFGGLAYDYASTWDGTVIPVNPNGTRNGWRQIVLSYDGTNARSYSNASTPNVVAATRYVPWVEGSINSYILTFGHGDTTNQTGVGQNYFKGNVGIVRLYNRALSDSEVLSNYNTTKAVYGL